MLIAIPSKERATRQITYRELPSEIRQQTEIFVDEKDYGPYKDLGFPVVAVQETGIGASRQAICEYARRMGQNKVLMFDDDLTFATRRLDDPTKFRAAAPEEISGAINEVQTLLDRHAHVAIASREGANRRADALIYNTRALRALAYRVDILYDEGIRFTHMELMEDFYVQLMLLTRGYEHVSINWLVQNQGGSNTAGGCSTYRTMETQSAAARRLASVFPDFVKVVQKETKVAWGGQPREDVIIQWKAAYEYGRTNQPLNPLD